ncbi:ferritin 1 heavy chain [Lasioglossum baleicum]|uniref:ferritin 1 heavy chain n=1 Tax=Lasioglossum baleicum TaxID=434251 RepID=UPI003FCC490D
MKPIYVLFVTFFCIVGSLGEELQCKIGSDKKIGKWVDMDKKIGKWVDMESDCAKQLWSQVNKEIEAAITYLSMGVHFAKDTNHRPGFSKFFFEAANEERGHAIKIIEYFLMRGQLISKETQILNYQNNQTNHNDHSNQKDQKKQKHQNNQIEKLTFVPLESGVHALEEALKLEAKVTDSIREIIKTCENVHSFNDYHLVDYLTTDFLDEQYKGMRDLAGKISTLNKMMGTHGPLGEFLFDKKLLNGEV